MSKTVDLDLPDPFWKSRAEKAEADAERMRELLRMAWMYTGMHTASPALLADLHNAIDDAAADLGLRLPV